MMYRLRLFIVCVFCLTIIGYQKSYGIDSVGYTNEEDYSEINSPTGSEPSGEVTKAPPRQQSTQIVSQSKSVGSGDCSFFKDSAVINRCMELKSRYASKYSDSAIESEVESILSSCVAMEQNAKSKCTLITPEQMALLGVAANIGGAVASGSSVKAKCEAAEMVNTLSTGANGAIGGICMSIAKSCSSDTNTGSCGNVADVADKAKKAAKKRMDTYCAAFTKMKYSNENEQEALGNMVGCEEAEGEYKTQTALYKEAAKHAGKCLEYEQVSYRYLMQAAQTAIAVAASAQCVKSAGERANAMNRLIGNGSCADDPLKRQTPECVCQDPTQRATNSLCAGYLPNGGLPGAGAGGGLAGINNKGTDALGSDPALEELKRLGNNFKGAGPGSQNIGKNEGVSAGGGSGGPQAGQSGGLNPEGGGGEAPDLKTDIDQGYQRTRGGGGDGMFASRGGGGYGSGGDGDRKKSGFDLSQFLPWNKKKPSGPDRQISTAGLKAEGVTAATGPSIWEKVSNRIRVIRGRLE